MFYFCCISNDNMYLEYLFFLTLPVMKMIILFSVTVCFTLILMEPFSFFPLLSVVKDLLTIHYNLHGRSSLNNSHRSIIASFEFFQSSVLLYI